ncbi:hypothetical protein R1flu_006387 [Riccia fluitans]|uniref:Uncharacterized protein n=1 Tax=Riccia fluitans TaxID=41844 RepID=A0ABD1YVV0_9MARC
MEVKFTEAFGMKIMVLSSSEDKMEEALMILDTDKFIDTSDKPQIEVRMILDIFQEVLWKLSLEETSEFLVSILIIIFFINLFQPP